MGMPEKEQPETEGVSRESRGFSTLIRGRRGPGTSSLTSGVGRQACAFRLPQCVIQA